ncbi:MAG: type II toxin-antitoxin system Phd/YefM family antitoxin [Caldilineaceae bacterium]|nr:type II toxin-antitoxin system Phd/YefM family antitoxin [Caldilineaceae bacterium]
MAVVTIDSNDARIQLRELLDKADKADTVIVRYRKPVAVLIGYDAWMAVRTELEEYRRQQALATLGELPAS